MKAGCFLLLGIPLSFFFPELGSLCFLRKLTKTMDTLRNAAAAKIDLLVLLLELVVG